MVSKYIRLAPAMDLAGCMTCIALFLSLQLIAQLSAPSNAGFYKQDAQASLKCPHSSSTVENELLSHLLVKSESEDETFPSRSPHEFYTTEYQCDFVQKDSQDKFKGPVIHSPDQRPANKGSALVCSTAGKLNHSVADSTMQPAVVVDLLDVNDLESLSEDGVETTSEDGVSKSSPLKGTEVYPKSWQKGFVSPLLITTEVDAVNLFTRTIMTDKPCMTNKSLQDDDFVEYELDDFSIYRPAHDKQYPWEMRGLQNLGSSRNAQYCFDGVLRHMGLERYVQAVLFRTCSVGNYGVEHDSIDDNIFIQSEANENTKILYRLKSPSPEYTRYYEGFLWIADLAKHFVDYCQAVSLNKSSISIHNFRMEFAQWLHRNHEKSPTFQAWYNQHNCDDLRSAVCANIEFLFREAISICDSLRDEPIWAEIMTRTAIPKQPIKETSTIVTPYVHECFKDLKFGHLLKKVHPKPNPCSEQYNGDEYWSLTARNDLDHRSNSHNKSPALAPANSVMRGEMDMSSISVGDVVGVPKDEESLSLWKDEASRWRVPDDCWYVYIQKVHIDTKKLRSFDVIWLYRPSDTPCALMKYPYQNELFMSDHCSCSSTRIFEDEVLCKVSVIWNSLPGASNSEFFIRQTYLANKSFVTFEDSHKSCVHFRHEQLTDFQKLIATYQIGDTVLAKPPKKPHSKYGLEPYEIVDFDGNLPASVKVKRLLRRRDLGDTGRGVKPNELVYTEELLNIPASNVWRKCLVRFYSTSMVVRGQIPAPYNRDGTGDAFYITSRVINYNNGQELHEIKMDDLPPSLIQGFDPKEPPNKAPLRGLDMFCGGGNFGRGLEEGGAIQFNFAVDLNKNAIHTYLANLARPESTNLFFGSVDDMLAQALAGNPNRSLLIPSPGQLEFIAAGSPCPGFSPLNAQRNNAKGLKNQSLVASVVAYIDFYRPKYALLENVINMAQTGSNRDEDVLSQLICCVVGMGYQTQLSLLDAWSFGNPQSRSRLFLIIAAPGLKLPPQCPLTHSHPQNTNNRGLGIMASGQPFAERLFLETPFPFVTAREATADLPDIGDAQTYHCTAFPDHRTSIGVGRKLQAQLEAIPRRPRGMCFRSTLDAGRMSAKNRALFPAETTQNGNHRQCVNTGSKAWGRISPEGLFPTIVTCIAPACSRSGGVLHWDQQRLVTVMEAKIAQGCPNDEVITGSPVEQMKVVGNGVARAPSLSQGLTFRNAWLDHNPVFPMKPPLTWWREAESSASDQPEATDISFDEASSYEKIQQTLMAVKSPVTPVDCSTPTSAPTTDYSNSASQKRRHNLPHDLVDCQKSKKSRLLGPASMRDPKTLWYPAKESPTSSLPTSKYSRSIAVDVLQCPSDVFSSPSSKHLSLQSKSLIHKLEEVNKAEGERLEAEKNLLQLEIQKPSLPIRKLKAPQQSKPPSLPAHRRPALVSRVAQQLKVIDLTLDDDVEDGDGNEHQEDSD